MALTLFDASVPVFRQGLTALSGTLDKAVAHCEARKIDPAVLLNDRLYPDMLTFTFQVTSVINHSCCAVRRLMGEKPERPGGMTTFEALQAGVGAALADLERVTPADLEGAESREILFPTPRGDMRFSGQGYLLSFALPNYYFHAAIAFAILRHDGVEIGKRDFMGQVQQLA